MFFLPHVAHIYERVCELFVMAVGGRIGYFTGDPLRLIEDVQVLKPYFFPSVPRVLNRLYMSAMQNTKLPGVKGRLISLGKPEFIAHTKQPRGAFPEGFRCQAATTSVNWRTDSPSLGCPCLPQSSSCPRRKNWINYFRVCPY